MAAGPSRLGSYPCGDYLISSWSNDGLWDEGAQLWLLEPLSRVDELVDVGFLVVGRPGVDGIAFGYRVGKPGFWAHYPMETSFVLLAPSIDEFVAGWLANTISV